MQKKKVIMYANVFDTVVGQGIAYMEFFREFGDVILVTSESDLQAAIAEGHILALPGGADVLSSTYGTRPGYQAGKPNPHYEFLDDHLLMPWLSTGKPIIAICRGIQVLNVRMGGTLHRHVINHVQDSKYSRGHASDIMHTHFENCENVPINSFHHQGLNKIAPGFDVVGWSDLYMGCPSLRDPSQVYYNTRYEAIDKPNKYGPKFTKEEDAPMIPEMIIHESLPYIGFQYHPEELMDDFSLSHAHAVVNRKKSPIYAGSTEKETVKQNAD